MNKLVFSILIGFFMLSMVFAQSQGIHEPGTGLSDSELKEANQGTGLGLTDNNQVESEMNVETQTQEKNVGEDIQIQNQVQVTTQNQMNQGNNGLQIHKQDNNGLGLQRGNAFASTDLNLIEEQTPIGIQLHAKLSNGVNAQVKVMPDAASDKALERLQLKFCSQDNNCQIQLKEVGDKNQLRLAYELNAEKQSKVFGLFKAKMQVQAQIDAETGEVIKSKKPWWAFLATEQEE